MQWLCLYIFTFERGLAQLDSFASQWIQEVNRRLLSGLFALKEMHLYRFPVDLLFCT